MSDHGEPDPQIENSLKTLSLSLAHGKLTEIRKPPLTVEEEEKILQSLFVTRREYEQYSIDLREREERERQDAKDREDALKAQRESDPRYWKRLYESTIESEQRRREEQTRTRTLWISGIVFGAIVLLVTHLLMRLIDKFL